MFQIEAIINKNMERLLKMCKVMNRTCDQSTYEINHHSSWTSYSVFFGISLSIVIYPLNQNIWSL